MPHAVGLRVKCSADEHEGYCQYSVGTREMDDEGDVILHQWHICEWGSNICGRGQGEVGIFWFDLWRPWAPKAWS